MYDLKPVFAGMLFSLGINAAGQSADLPEAEHLKLSYYSNRVRPVISRLRISVPLAALVSLDGSL